MSWGSRCRQPEEAGHELPPAPPGSSETGMLWLAHGARLEARGSLGLLEGLGASQASPYPETGSDPPCSTFSFIIRL